MSSLPKSAKTPKTKLCHCCGQTLTRANFTDKLYPDVCLLCLLANEGTPPAFLPFDPKNLTKEEAAEVIRDTILQLGPDAAHIDTIEAYEVAERILIQRSLLAFVHRFKADYDAGWVHEDICRRLERFVENVAQRNRPRLLLCMPPRHGKSTLTSNFLPAWILGHYPHWEIIAASHTQSLALKFSGFIRDLLRDPSYQNVFPRTLLNPDSQSKEAWDTTAKGGYLAAGVGTGITGRGAHVLIVDDPVKDMEAADSATIRENTWEWYTSTAYTRLAPGGGVLGILTLWNEDDWGGRIIEVSESKDGDVFEVVRYPAINEGYSEYLAADQHEIIHIDADAKTPPPEGATLLRAPNTALHPARYDLPALLAIKKNYYARGNQRTWSALFQQRPSPEDGVFLTKPMFRYYGSAPRHNGACIYQAWDFAISEGTESDFTVCATILQDGNDNLYLLDIKRFRSGYSIEIVDVMIDHFVYYKTNVLGVEDGQIWKALSAQFTKRCQERRVYPSVEVLKPLTDKKVRAHPLRGRMQLGKVYFPEQAEWKHDCVQELLTFPAGKHDDQVDAIAWCVRLTLTRSAPTIVEAKPMKSWRDQLKVTGIADVSHMAS